MKKTVVFIPGMMCDERLYREQISHFSQSFNVLVADISRHSTIEESAANVLQLVHNSTHFSLIGLSMGGIVAMEIARLNEARISNLILISTTPFSEKKEISKHRKVLINQVEKGKLSQVMEQHYIPNYFYQKTNLQYLEKICLNMAEDLGPKVFTRQSKALMNRPCQIESLRALNCRTLILCGREDQICPLSYHFKINELIKHSKLVVLDNTGHLPTLESFEATNLYLKNFIASKESI